MTSLPWAASFIRAKNKPKNKANLAQDDNSDLEAIMLMAQTGTDVVDESSCYLDTGCSTHMTSRKD